MILQRISLSVSTLFLVALVCAAQQARIEPGNPRELKGVNRICVQADDEKTRQKIAAQIKQQLPQLMFVEKAEEAQVVLIFQETRRGYRNSYPRSPRGSQERRGSTQQVQSPNAPNFPTGEFEIVAVGEVIKSVGPDSSRRLMRFDDALSSPLEDKLSSEFAGAFIKIYKKANRK